MQRISSLLRRFLGDLGNNLEVFITGPRDWFYLEDDKLFLSKTGDNTPSLKGTVQSRWLGQEGVLYGWKRMDLHRGLLEAILHAGWLKLSRFPLCASVSSSTKWRLFVRLSPVSALSVFNSPGTWVLYEPAMTMGPSIPLDGWLDIHIKLWPPMHSEVPRLHLRDTNTYLWCYFFFYIYPRYKMDTVQTVSRAGGCSSVVEPFLGSVLSEEKKTHAFCQWHSMLLPCTEKPSNILASQNLFSLL